MNVASHTEINVIHVELLSYTRYIHFRLRAILYRLYALSYLLTVCSSVLLTVKILLYNVMYIQGVYKSN